MWIDPYRIATEIPPQTGMIRFITKSRLILVTSRIRQNMMNNMTCLGVAQGVGLQARGLLLIPERIPCPDLVQETACPVKGRAVRTQGHAKVKVIVQGRGRLPAQVIVQRVHLIPQGHLLQGRGGHCLQGYGGQCHQGRRGHRLQGHGSEGYPEGHVIGNITDGVGGARITLIEDQGEKSSLK